MFFYYALFLSLSLSLSLSSVQNFVCLIRVLPHKVEREGEGNKAYKVLNKGEREGEGHKAYNSFEVCFIMCPYFVWAVQ